MSSLTIKKLEKRIDAELHSWLHPFGFSIENGGGVSRWKEDVYQWIACVVIRVGGQNRIRPVGQLGFKSTQSIYQMFMHHEHLESPNRSVDLQANYAHFTKDWTSDLRCQDENDWPTFINELREFVINKLYPTLEENSDPIRVLDLYALYDEKNRQSTDLPGWHGHSSALSALILAKLYCPERYYSLKERYAPIISHLIPEYQNRAIGLIKYLDEIH